MKNPNPKTEIYLGLCKECECEFEYNNADINSCIISNGIMGPGYRSYKDRWINCPNCGTKIKV